MLNISYSISVDKQNGAVWCAKCGEKHCIEYGASDTDAIEKVVDCIKAKAVTVTGSVLNKSREQ